MALLAEVSPDLLAGVMLASAAVVFPVLLFGPNAPYGRFSAAGWGPLIPARIAWLVSLKGGLWGDFFPVPLLLFVGTFLLTPPLPPTFSLPRLLARAQTQEIWSFAIPVVYFAFLASPSTIASIASSPRTLVLIAAFLVHYAQRDLLYPFLMRPGRPTPLAVWIASTAFCLFNGALQTWSWVESARTAGEAEDGSLSGAFWLSLGLGLFAWGMAQNVACDASLRRLRADLERKARERRATDEAASSRAPTTPEPAAPKTHGIPRGGLFERVSAANYFAECVEWTGYAIAAGTPAAWAFAAFTWANLAPRAARYHQWYLDTFPDYPTARKRLVPYLW